ncbi:MAG TPA: hypothetical protein VHI52_07860 [Verrucomicrobiae bacterium]|nr:hypothetical protein [Verrucomicrobiae bacterium]
MNTMKQLLLLTVTALSFIFSLAARGDALIYQTGFEASEGYRTNLDLAGQNGWQQAGSGGNGLVTDLFSGSRQQAYVGFTPPSTGDDFLLLYQPINKGLAHVKFSVNMAISDSSNSNYDDFYWTLFDQQLSNLVTLDFDNYELKVYYYLDGTNSRVWSGLTFTNAVEYPLTMDLDFANNRWSARFDGRLLATNQPLTTVGAPLNLGDIDAGWVIYDPAAPGDNFMVFDDYSVTATIPPPQISLLGTVGNAPALRLTGLNNNVFVIEASTNLLNWTALKTNTTSGGSFDYIDNTASALNGRFYRGRWLPN